MTYNVSSGTLDPTIPYQTKKPIIVSTPLLFYASLFKSRLDDDIVQASSASDVFTYLSLKIS